VTDACGSSVAQPPDPATASSAGGSPMSSRTRESWLSALGPYIAIARPDHWFKNVFMALGVLLAYFYQPALLQQSVTWPILWAVAATCCMVSSNYVLNEIHDAPSDLNHPTKRDRPVPSGQVWLPAAYAEWLLLTILGLGMASIVNQPFLYTGVILLGMGVVYNIPPLRSKELSYVDVLSEAINNPIRLMLGWFAFNPAEFPPVSLLIAYWMIGAFFMATKRFAEYRSIGNPVVAGLYRVSFRHYDETKMLISMFFYTTCFGIFFGIFIIRYHLELILFVPLVAGFICYYLHVAFKEHSAVQSPERLYRERGLAAYFVLCAIVFVGLMFTQIPVLYAWFNVPSSSVAPLWRL
jgi:decaprenyl-phosphate phosphoribosyltransferase